MRLSILKAAILATVAAEARDDVLRERLAALGLSSNVADDGTWRVFDAAGAELTTGRVGDVWAWVHEREATSGN